MALSVDQAAAALVLNQCDETLETREENIDVETMNLLDEESATATPRRLKIMAIFGAALAVAAVVGIAGFRHSGSDAAFSKAAKIDGVVALAEENSMPLEAGISRTTEATGTKKLYTKIVAEISDMINSLDDVCDIDQCPQGEFAACLLRLAGHDFMDFKDGSGGSDGCLDPDDPDNNGLWECLKTGENGVKLETVWNNHKDDVSLADFVVIAGEAAMITTRKDLEPALTFIDRFRFGRTTRSNCAGQTRLPDPDHGCAAVNETFMQNLGLTARASAALMGVHTLGRARPEHSGFDGWWTDPVSASHFNNNYYLSLLLKGWAPETTDKGKHQWKRVGDGNEEHEMMLNTDICLAYGDFANDASKDTCCAWITPAAFKPTESLFENGEDPAVEAALLLDKQTGHGEQWCGFDFAAEKLPEAKVKHVRLWCCTLGPVKGPAEDCGDPDELKGIAAFDVMEFANDEKAWLEELYSAWKQATEKGQDNLFTPV